MVKEGFILEDVKIFMAGNNIGGAQSLSFTRTQENKVVGGNGQLHAIEILDGAIRINGSIERLWIDDAIINATNDNGDKLLDLKEGHNAYFKLVGTTVNKTPVKKVALIDCKIKGFSGALALGTETKNTFEFDALKMI